MQIQMNEMRLPRVKPAYYNGTCDNVHGLLPCAPEMAPVPSVNGRSVSFVAVLAHAAANAVLLITRNVNVKVDPCCPPVISERLSFSSTQ